MTLNDEVRRLIPPDSPYVCSNTHDSAYPHLIVQFPKDARVQAGDIDLCASQSNRIIYHCDADNIAMKLNEDFADLITGAKALLISGFNAMQSEALLTDRLAALLRIMESLPEEALVFYEDAGFYEPAFSPLIYRALAGRIDIFSLNEDELQAYLKRRLDLLDVAQISAALAELQSLIAAPTLVVHTSNWALACGEGAARFAGALTAGVTMATTRFCYGDDFTVAHYREVDQLAPGAVNARFANSINNLPGGRLYCVPVAQVDPPSPTTIGLGDAFVGGFLSALANR